MAGFKIPTEMESLWTSIPRKTASEWVRLGAAGSFRMLAPPTMVDDPRRCGRDQPFHTD
jgi:hypothetical protein